ncbi:MAG: bifunctional phosphopantothenoylcysteine decarboxylase/phosphopantothenate--cysteine ligase CoaBC [Actinomycetota bacterium]|nr:bifunctional phosphopantothenoylcysteine decarboxylase/phosphopantothenate--cysteine ligase CoaBC [Actinomycetota bacterium]
MLGVCGGIAAYKAVEVCRRLIDAGAHVSPVLTRGATHFVGELTFSALGSERTETSLWDGSSPIPHTRLGQRADLIIVVPATARLLGAYAAGISSDLLTATLLATRAPVVVCPAMHTEMWEHPAVTENMATLARRGVHVVAPGTGRLAGGDQGKGRLAEPDDIVAAASMILAAGSDLAGLRALVTAGGTREPIDAVRYIGNRSSGKQGHAVAEQLAHRGATVVMVTTTDRPVPAGIEAIRVETATEMEAVVSAHAPSTDIVVMAAAVADFRPRTVVGGKLKKEAGLPDVVLEPTADILAGLGASRRPGQTLVGFAAETVDPTGRNPASRQALVDLAIAKLTSKRADLIVANDVAAPGTGFSHDTNAVVIVDADGRAHDVGLAGKAQVAASVVDAVVAYRRHRPIPAGPDDGGER